MCFLFILSHALAIIVYRFEIEHWVEMVLENIFAGSSPLVRGVIFQIY